MMENLTGRESRERRFMFAMQHLMLMMQQVDDTCVQLTKTIDKRDLHVIGFIGDHNDVKMKDIADLLDVPMSTTTGIVQKLVDKQLVHRAASALDRRAIILLLSTEGQRIFDLLNTMRIKMTKRITDDLALDEFNTLIQLLEKIQVILKAHVEVA